MRANDVVLGLVVLCVAGAVFGYAATLPTPPMQDFGPGFFPKLLSVGLALAGVVLVIGGLRRRAPALTLADWWRTPRRRLNVASVPIAVVFYILASPALGFIPSAIVIVFVVAVMLGARVWPAAALAAATSVAMHLVFVEALKVPLPWGLLEPLVYRGSGG